MTAIGLGSERHRKRAETFADGALIVRPPRGLRATERALLHALPRGKSGSALVVNSAEAAW